MAVVELKHPDIEPRGRTYYIYKRVPVRYASVEDRKVINTSLKTRDFEQAKVNLKSEWDRFVRGWEASLLGQDRPGTREAYDGARAVLGDMGLPLCRIDKLAAGSLEDLLTRIEAAARYPANSVAAAAALGAIEIPNTQILGMPAEFERIREPFLKAKNRVQRRQWRNKYRRAAKVLAALVGNRSMKGLTDHDAERFRKHWWDRCEKEGITAQYAEKHLAYMEQMVDAYYQDLGVLRHDHINPFRGLSLGETPGEKWHEEKRKLALPVWWILEVLYNPIKTAGLNEEARDIAILCAELGTRENEIHDLPPEDIVLDHVIPHLILDVELEGEFRRELKTAASKRKVPLTRRALAIMRKYPHGFVRYRNNANYSNTINKNFRENNLFPVYEEDPTRHYTIGGLRHTFEDRMWHAKIDNEMRAFLMGHSIEAIRGRPVYGTDLELPLRVLLLEKIAFPTDDWTPRSHQEIDAEIDWLLEEDGFRRK